MIDLIKTRLPSAIEVDGSLFYLHTDFQFWLNFAQRIENKKAITVDDFKFLFLDQNHLPEDLTSAFNEIIAFGFPKREIPRSIGGGSSVKCLDYSIDADLIYSAFMQQYQIDLLDESLHLHWYKFQALLSGLRETKLNDVMGYRSYDEFKKYDDKKERKELRQIWELPTVLNEQEQKDLDAFNSLFE